MLQMLWDGSIPRHLFAQAGWQGLFGLIGSPTEVSGLSYECPIDNKGHDPLYPLHQLRRRCVAIVFLRTAAAAERENWHARFKRNRNPTISTDWARLNTTRLWRCNAARRIHWYAIEAIVVTYWVFNQKRHTMTYICFEDVHINFITWPTQQLCIQRWIKIFTF